MCRFKKMYTCDNSVPVDLATLVVTGGHRTCVFATGHIIMGAAKQAIVTLIKYGKKCAFFNHSVD